MESFTDDTGVFQHARFSIPRRNEGYTTDDNARALIACTKYFHLANDQRAEVLARIYLAFLYHMQKPGGNFHNYLSYERHYLDVDGSDDCLGRALWSCGLVVNSNLPKHMRLVAKEIFDKGFPWVWKSVSLRFYAFAIMGLRQYYSIYKEDSLLKKIQKLADNFIQCYKDESRKNWHWFEPYLIYDNARLSHALFEAYSVVGKKQYLDIAKESFDFLVNEQMIQGKFVPIGNDGWYKRGGKRAFYDQQPLEATAMVETAVDAYYITKDKYYTQIAFEAFSWFLGKNTKNAMLYNPETAGCFDGLNCDSVNMNQGAESSISYLLARLKIEEINKGRKESNHKKKSSQAEK